MGDPLTCYVAFYSDAPSLFCAAVYDDSPTCEQRVVQWLNEGRCVKKVPSAVARDGINRYSDAKHALVPVDAPLDYIFEGGI